MRRAMTDGEVAITHSVFGDAIDCDKTQICRSKWFPFQPRKTVMAPTGNIHFHPRSTLWMDDYSTAHLALRGLFVHELVHVWQYQKGIFLPLKRHAFCRYDYSLKPGWTLERYGLEQQAEIVRHAYMLREGGTVAGAPDLDQYAGLLPFTPWQTGNLPA